MGDGVTGRPYPADLHATNRVGGGAVFRDARRISCSSTGNDLSFPAGDGCYHTPHCFSSTSILLLLHLPDLCHPFLLDSTPPYLLLPHSKLNCAPSLRKGYWQPQKLGDDAPLSSNLSSMRPTAALCLSSRSAACSFLVLFSHPRYSSCACQGLLPRPHLADCT